MVAGDERHRQPDGKIRADRVKNKLKSITIDIDCSMVNVEGHQEEAGKGYNPKKPGNHCYNIQFSFCDEIKAYLTGYVRSGDTYTVKRCGRNDQ
jgi:hypothetical protein